MALNDVRIVQLPERHVEGKRLGRHVLHDPRSRDFTAERATNIVSVTHHATGLPLDQGQIGSFTPNALSGALDSPPHFAGHTVLNEKDAISLYGLQTQPESNPYPP